MPPHDRLPLTSVSPIDDRLTTLKGLFPDAFTEDKVDFERLKQALGASVQTDRERYGLSWAGKSEAIHILQSLSVGTLRPVREQSVNFDTTENLIIEGDNLEVLKLLQNSYFGKVKMVYIDPPYNTGNEFIYPDNYSEGLDEYLRYSGQVSAEGVATTSNKETDGRFHSKWLSMMYPRLFLAKNLLSEEGIIFVSIDDNEIHDLRLMMNEIFGEENFFSNIVWQHSVQGKNDVKTISLHHNYLVAFSRSDLFVRGTLQRTEEHNKAYSNPDNDANGMWRAGDVRSPNYRENLRYNIPTPSGKSIPPPENGWRWDKKKVNAKISTGEIVFVDDETRILRKIYLSAQEGRVPESIWFAKEVGSTREGSEQLKVLFDGFSPFDTPKPSRLIRRMMEVAGVEDNDTVVDFFAGSGTTAQAIFEMNQEDGGNRHFILVQLPEPTKNKQFPTIASVTRERVRRVITNLNKDDATTLNLADGAIRDRGFKAFSLTRSNFKIWDGSQGATDDPDTLAHQLELFADNLLPDATPENILFEILLKSGCDLNVSREEIAVAEQKAYAVGNTLIVCLERKLSRATLDAIIAYDPKPKTVICLDEAFHGDDALLTNALLQMQDAGIAFQTI